MCTIMRLSPDDGYEYVGLEFFNQNKIAQNPELENFVNGLRNSGLRISDYQCVIKEGTGELNVVPKMKLTPHFNAFPFYGDNSICDCQKKVSSYLEIKFQIGQIIDTLNFLMSCEKNDSSEGGVKIANAFEVMFAGCFTIYFSFFSNGRAFSRLNLKSLELDDKKKKIHENLENIRNKHYAHKDNAMNVHFISMYNKPVGDSSFEICINPEESYPVYLYADKKLLSEFRELLESVKVKVESLLDKYKTSYQEMLNLTKFKNKLKNIDGYTYKEFYDKVLPTISEEKKNMNRDNIFKG